jgi:hypothetical protein
MTAVIGAARDPDDATREKELSMKTRLLLVAVLALLAATVPVSAQPKDIVDTAVAAGSFKTLAKLLTDAGLIDVMKRPGPYTVFAPTDEAFAKVPKDVLDSLAKDKAKLVAVLEYHVLTSKWTTDDIKLVKQTGTVQGSSRFMCLFCTSCGVFRILAFVQLPRHPCGLIPPDMLRRPRGSPCPRPKP